MAIDKQGVSDDGLSSVNFEGFIQDWRHLHIFFMRVSSIPPDVSAFESRYGGFDDPEGVKAFLSACAETDEIAGRFGNPQTLKEQIAKDPNYLMTDTPPETFYGHVVWIASKVQNVAATFSATLDGVKKIIDPSAGDTRQRADHLKMAFVGTKGLVPAANTVKVATMDCLEELAPYQARLSSIFEAFSQTKLINEANQKIGCLRSVIKTLREEVDHARKKSKKAVMDKEKSKRLYETLTRELDAKQVELRSKELFVKDLNGFFVIGNRVVPAVQDITNTLEKIGDEFSAARDVLMSVCTAASVEQLSDYKWVERALNLPVAIKKWNELQKAAQGYIQNSLVNSGSLSQMDVSNH